MAGELERLGASAVHAFRLDVRDAEAVRREIDALPAEWRDELPELLSGAHEPHARRRGGDAQHAGHVFVREPFHIAKDDDHAEPLGKPAQCSIQLDAVERAILRMGAFELTHGDDVPWRVVINECVELAREFGAEQSHRYVNGILDNLARRTREEARSAG